MVNKHDIAIRQLALAEMAKTPGWKILKEELLDKRQQAIGKLVNGSPANIDMQEVVVSRARIKIIDETLTTVAESIKED